MLLDLFLMIVCGLGVAGAAMEIALHAGETDVSKVEFFVDIQLAAKTGTGKRGREGKTDGRQRGAFHKRTTIHLRH